MKTKNAIETIELGKKLGELIRYHQNKIKTIHLQGNLGTFASKIDDNEYWKETLDYALGMLSKSENPDVYSSREHYFSK